MYIYSRRNVAGRSIEFSAKMVLFWLFCILNIRHAVLSIDHANGMPTHKLSLATRLHGKQLIEDNLNKRYSLEALIRNQGLVLTPLAANVDLWKPSIKTVVFAGGTHSINPSYLNILIMFKSFRFTLAFTYIFIIIYFR